jgi:hypothetical protein
MSTLMKHLDMNIIAGHVISLFNRIELDQHFAMTVLILIQSSVPLPWRLHQNRCHSAEGVIG